MPTRCFLITATDQVARSLRRYASGSTCTASGAGYHNAHTPLDTVPIVMLDNGCWSPPDDPEIAHDDPRWPTHCACGYAFQASDTWQVFASRIYTRQDTGEDTTLHDAPVGAMWDADWYISLGWVGPDGRCLCVRLPDGVTWCIDQPSQGGGRWTRTGEAPLITARPSILSSGYHGWLTDGILSDDIEGRHTL